MKFLYIFLVSIIFLGMFAGSVSAHLAAGQDVNKNGYHIDFGYAPKIVQSGSPTNLLIILSNETTSNAINITSTWIRISQGDNVTFAGNLKALDGSASMLYTFPKSGNYTLDFKFETLNETIETETLNLNVVGNNNNNTSEINIYILIILVIIVILMLIRFLHFKPSVKYKKVRKNEKT